MGDEINNRIGIKNAEYKQDPPKVIDFGEMTIWGGERLHAILCLDPAMLDNHLPSLMLFLSQLIDQTKAEGKYLDLTIHIKGGETPIKLMTVTEGDKSTEGTVDDILAYLFEAAVTGIKGTSLKSKKEGFSLGDMAEIDAHEELEQYPRDNDVIFVFEPDSATFSEVPEERDLVSVAFRSDRAAYPYKFNRVKTNEKTKTLLDNLKPISPCTMQAKYAHLFGEYYQENGLPVLKRLFGQSRSTLPYVFKHSLSEFMKHKGLVHDASICNSEDALSTAVSVYFGRELDTFGFFLAMSNPSLALRSLMLFTDGENRLPEADEVSALPSGFYEMLTELSQRGDEKAAPFFIHSILGLYFDYADNRFRHGERVDIKPEPEKTFAEYFKRINALPSDFIEGLVGVESLEEMHTEGKRKLGYLTFENKKGSEFREQFNDIVLKTFLTLAGNFKTLTAEEKSKEVKKALSWCSGKMKEIIFSKNCNLDTFGVFLDIMYEALSDEPELRRTFTSGLVRIITELDPKEIFPQDQYDRHYFYYVVSYLHKKGVLNAWDAKRFVEWTLKFERMDEYLIGHAHLSQVNNTWVDMWGYLSEGDKRAFSKIISEKSAAFVDKVIKWTNFTQDELQEEGILVSNWEDRHEAYFFNGTDQYVDDPGLSTIAGLSKILGVKDLVPIVVEMLDNEYINTRKRYYLDNAITAVHHYKKGREWLEFVCYLTFAAPTSYKLINRILEVSKDDANRDLILKAVHTGLVKHYAGRLSMTDDDKNMGDLLLFVRSVLDEDIDGFVKWFQADTDYGIGPYISAYFTKAFKTKIITKVLRLAQNKSKRELFKSFSRTFFWGDVGLIGEGYDSKIHDELFLELFSNLITMPAVKGETIDVYNSNIVDNFVVILFNRLGPKTQKSLIGEMLSILRRERVVSDTSYDSFIQLFSSLLGQIKTAEGVLFTRPFFDVASKEIESETLNSDSKVVDLFLQRWEEFIGKYDTDVKCAVLADMLGRFPAALSVNDIDIRGLFTKVLRPENFKSAVRYVKKENELMEELSRLGQGETAIVAFSKTRSGKSKKILPAFEECSQLEGEKRLYLWIENKELSEKYKISSFPSVVEMNADGSVAKEIGRHEIYELAENGYQDPATAFKLGGHIAVSPYAPLIPRFFGDFLNKGTYREMIKGFVAEVSKKKFNSLKPRDVKSFLTATNLIYFRYDKDDYYDFALEMMRSDIPNHLANYFLYPMRNQYLHIVQLPFGKLAAFQEGLMMIATFFEKALEDKDISRERKKYIYQCFKQIETDIVEGLFKGVPTYTDGVKKIRDKFHYLEERFKFLLVQQDQQL